MYMKTQEAWNNFGKSPKKTYNVCFKIAVGKIICATRGGYGAMLSFGIIVL